MVTKVGLVEIGAEIIELAADFAKLCFQMSRRGKRAGNLPYILHHCILSSRVIFF